MVLIESHDRLFGHVINFFFECRLGLGKLLLQQ